MSAFEQMFEGFDRRKDGRSRRRLAVTTGASLLLYAGIGGAVLAFAGQATRAPARDEIDVSFAPPPPPPVAAAAPPPPPPPVPKGVEVKKVAKPLPRPALAAPQELPTAKADEVDPAAAAPAEIGDGAPGGTEGGSGPATAEAAPTPPPAPPPPTPTVRRVEPINLPEAATPPTPAVDNVQPDYPADARAAGREGQVILKIVVSERGEVTRVDVLRGDEPFTTAAITAVKRWRYAPAVVGGQPTAVFRIVKIPFRIKA